MILAQNKTTFKIKCHMFSITLRKFHTFPLSQKIIFDKNFIFKYQMGGTLNCLGGHLKIKVTACLFDRFLETLKNHIKSTVTP